MTGKAGSNEASVTKKLHSREKIDETLPPSVEAEEKQNSKEAISKVPSDILLGDKLTDKNNSADANKAEKNFLNGTTKSLIKQLSKKPKKRQTSTSSLSNTSFSSSSSEISSSSISSKSVSPCSFSYSNQQTRYPFADYYADNSTQDPTYQTNGQFNHFAGNQMHSQMMNSQMLNSQMLNSQMMTNQVMNNQPIGTHLLDNQARSNLIAPESNYFPESANYPYYDQPIESYLPPSSSYNYPMNPSYSTSSLPLFRSNPPSGHHMNSLPAFKVSPSPYECNEMFLSNTVHPRSGADSEYLNYLNSTYQSNNQMLYHLPSQASQTSQIQHNAAASYNRLTCPTNCPGSFIQPISIRSDHCTTCGNFNHSSLSSLSHPMNHTDPLSQLEHSSNYTNHPLNPICHPASQSTLSSRSDCSMSQFACEKLRIDHHVCSRARNQQCTSHQIDCHPHRACCRSPGPKTCSNICRIDTCEPFEQNYIESSCIGCAGYDCSGRRHACSSSQHCNLMQIRNRTVCHPNACHRHHLHPADLDACKPRNCPCLQSNLMPSQLSSSDFADSCTNQSTNCEVVSAKKALDQFETDSGIATRCNSTANGSLDIE